MNLTILRVTSAHPSVIGRTAISWRGANSFMVTAAIGCSGMAVVDRV